MFGNFFWDEQLFFASEQKCVGATGNNSFVVAPAVGPRLHPATCARAPRGDTLAQLLTTND